MRTLGNLIAFFVTYIQSGIMVGLFQVLRFFLQILIPPTAPYSLIIPSAVLYSFDTDSREVKRKEKIERDVHIVKIVNFHFILVYFPLLFTLNVV
jgi:hypothetical protein